MAFKKLSMYICICVFRAYEIEKRVAASWDKDFLWIFLVKLNYGTNLGEKIATLFNLSDSKILKYKHKLHMVFSS